MILSAPSDYLVQAKWFGVLQMIIWCKPNDLECSKWLFGSSQMIWSAPNDYLVQAKWFGALQLNTFSWNIFFKNVPSKAPYVTLKMLN